MTTIYSTAANTSTGRNGRVATDDGLLELNLTYPREMLGAGEATNPEQLFAAAYSADFSSAILAVARESRQKVLAAPVTTQIGIGPNKSGGFSLSVSLAVTLDLQQDEAEQLVRLAHQISPYSNAVKDNIAVQITVNEQALDRPDSTPDTYHAFSQRRIDAEKASHDNGCCGGSHG